MKNIMKKCFNMAKYIFKSVFDKINYSINIFKSIFDKINYSINSIKGLNLYESLAPIDIKDRSYFKELDEAIYNKDIKNIALSGPYGCGKSSILKTYIQSKLIKKRFLNISLAKFNNCEEENLKDANIINNIEENLLKHIFYQVKQSKIPLSRYKRIEKISLLKLVVDSINIIIFILLTVLLFKTNILINIEKNINLLKSNGIFNIKLTESVLNTLIILFLIILFFIIIKITEILKNNIQFNNIKFGSSEIPNIEISKNNKDQAFDKYIDEILYFFQVTKYEVVIFEDLDRFNNLEIFSRLRQLNTLINNSSQIKRKITFIYAIRDDIFKDKKERTKFFDFIIPVISVVNSSNSYDKITEKLKCYEKDIDKKLIRDISLYIDDMRLIKNMCNEFKIYNNNINHQGLKIDNNINNEKLKIDNNKLFSIIVYKNLYPGDFSKLINKKGLVGKVFNDEKYLDRIHERYREVKIKSLEKKYYDMRVKQIDLYIKEYISTENSVLYDIIKETSDEYIPVKCNLPIEFVHEFLMDHIFDEEWYKYKVFCNRNSDEEKIYNREDSNIVHLGNLGDLCLDIEKEKEKEEIQINIEAEELKQHIKTENIKYMKIKEAIDKFGVDYILEEELRKEHLIVYLIKNGYIDETYNYYITYFYEGRLKLNEINFIKHLKSGNSNDFDCTIHNKSNVMEKIYPSECKNKGILSYDIVDFIIENKNKYNEHYNSLLEYLLKDEIKDIEEKKEFITKYTLKFIEHIKISKDIEINKNKIEFINKIIEFNSIWELVEGNYFLDEEKENIVYNLIKKVVNKENISKNINHKFDKYISDKSITEIYNIFKENIYNSTSKINYKHIQEIVSILKNINIKFNNIGLDYSRNINHIELFKEIIINNLYIINYNNINYILSYFELNEGLNYSYILSYENKDNIYINFLNYLNENIDSYIDTIYIENTQFLYEDILVKDILMMIKQLQKISLDQNIPGLDIHYMNQLFTKYYHSDLHEHLLNYNEKIDLDVLKAIIRFVESIENNHKKQIINTQKEYLEKDDIEALINMVENRNFA